VSNHLDGHVAPTLEAVAARAGVSRATASRVLRGSPRVSAAAKQAVEEAVEALAYTPNRAARSLVTGRSDSIAFYVDETEDRMFNDPFFLGMLRTAHAGVAAAGMQLIVSVASAPSDQERFLHFAAGGHVDGVLLMSLHGRDELPERLEQAGIPTVLSGRPLTEHDDLYYVDADNRGGAAMATRHLIESGRKHVATVTGPLDMCAGQDRLAGYKDAIREAGRRIRPSLVVPGDFTMVTGYDAIVRLLDRVPEVDAIFAASDLTALGVMRALNDRGRRIGDDVAVVGFDDIAESAIAIPALTTVRQPVADLGRRMTEVLLERVTHEPAPHRTVLPVELVQRESA
jgi:DNA-binding LacI/PurR family transcriptional regulator